MRQPLLSLPLFVFCGLAHAQAVRVVWLPSNHIIFNAGDGLIYATVPSLPAPVTAALDPLVVGNSVTAIQPLSGEVRSSVFIGSNPDTLAVADDGRSMYIGLGLTSAVRRFDALTQTPGQQFTLVGGANQYADDMAVQPGNPNVVAVAQRWPPNVAPQFAELVVYEDGVSRPTVVTRSNLTNRIAWSTSADVVYGADTQTTGFEFRRLAVNTAGISVDESFDGMVPGVADIKYADGSIYMTTGRKLHAATATLIGTYPATGLVEPDVVNRRVFFLTASGAFRVLRAFDMDTFVEVGTVPIPQVAASATVSDLVRWGVDGLAFRTGNGQIILVRTGLTNPGAAGACCLPTGGCAMLPVTACTSALGVWRGPESSCESAGCRPLGACCLADGTCVALTQAGCGGVWTAGAACGDVECVRPSAEFTRMIPLVTNRLIYNRTDGLIYASVPGRAGLPRGNSITTIDPVSGVVGASVPIGSEPGVLALSGTGRTLHVALNGAGAACSLNTATHEPDATYSLGLGGYGPLAAEDIEVQPGSETTVAVSRQRTGGYVAGYDSVAVFDHGQMRPLVIHNSPNNVLAFVRADTLLSYNNETTGHGIRRMQVSPEGIASSEVFWGLNYGFATDIKYAGGFLYTELGTKIDVSTMTVSGSFDYWGPMGIIEPDVDGRRLYKLVVASGHRRLLAFDIDSFALVGSTEIPGVPANVGVTDLYRWGDTGLVFRTPTHVVLINTPLVPPSCYANCDGSTVAPALTVLDFACFVNRFTEGDLYANCDGSLASPSLNVLDFNCFLNAFAAGCP
jgi:hypothetical protein